MRGNFVALLCAAGMLFPSAACVAARDRTEPAAVSAEVSTPQETVFLYEDFSKAETLPEAFMLTEKGVSRAELEDGALRFTVINGGSGDHVFLTYPFAEPLAGKVTVETRVRADSRAFANLLFFFCETDDFYDTSKVVTNLTMENYFFKNNAGKGWTATSVGYETGVWYDVKMVLDTEKGSYSLTVDGKSQGNLPFRSRAPIRYLRIGSQTAWADFSYSYLRVRTATAEEAAGPALPDYATFETDYEGTACPAGMKVATSGGGSADFSREGEVTLQTPTSGTVTVSKTFSAPLEGVIATEVTFRNLASMSNTFANVLFLRNSAIGGTAGYVVTLAVEGGYLRYNLNDKWMTFRYEDAYLALAEGARYTLRAVNDFTAQKTKVYLSGDSYLADGQTRALGQNIYLGEYDFRHKNAGAPDTFEHAIGTGKAGTKFTVEHLKFYGV